MAKFGESIFEANANYTVRYNEHRLNPTGIVRCKNCNKFYKLKMGYRHNNYHCPHCQTPCLQKT